MLFFRNLHEKSSIMMGSNLWNARFSKISKIRTLEIENLVEISMIFNEMVIRPTNKVQGTHLWYWFFKPDRLVKVSDFLKWFQSDFFKNRLKLNFFLSFATDFFFWFFYTTCKNAWKKLKTRFAQPALRGAFLIFFHHNT